MLVFYIWFLYNHYQLNFEFEIICDRFQKYINILHLF